MIKKIKQKLWVQNGTQTLKKCKKPTRVVGLGIAEHVVLFEVDDRDYEIEVIEDLVNYEPLHIGWVDDENDIPPALLRYLKKNYNVKNGYSKIAGDCFANHCDHCDVIQGNWMLFNEDSPLMALDPDGPEQKEKIEKLKIYSIGIEENLVLDWNFGYGTNDTLYFKYGTIDYVNIFTGQYGDEDILTYEQLYS